MKRFLWVALVLGAVIGSGCASLDSFNQLAANTVHDTIVASEQNRCTVHGAPCLSDAQFKAVNVELHRVSVSGAEYTKLRIAGTASTKDATTFLGVVAQTVANLSTAFPADTTVGTILTKLTELQVKATKFLGGN